MTASEIMEIRKRAKMTQAQFAKRLGTSIRAVQSWEQGQRHPNGPTSLMIEVISRNVRGGKK